MISEYSNDFIFAVSPKSDKGLISGMRFVIGPRSLWRSNVLIRPEFMLVVNGLSFRGDPGSKLWTFCVDQTYITPL
jgi:hypothetical protein